MKKILVFAVILGLLVPAAAFAATEFSLGGFIKLDAYWDSTGNTKNINQPTPRNNDPNSQHGNLRFTAQGSRFNFTIKGPKVFGAQTTGFIEMDFDSTTDSNASASNNYIPRMRHAMFRFNWPDSELLFGQYWSLFCSWYSESVQDGPFQVTGTPTARIPQIRFTQKFMQDWSVMALVGNANNYGAAPFNAGYSAVAGGATTNGGSAETPQIQGSVKYEHDFWGKAAYYGKPIPLTVQITGGWQRNTAKSQNLVLSTLDGANVNNNARMNSTHVDPWLAMASLFIPVIPTHSANLAGTASLLAQGWIGQGVSAFGFTGDATTVFQFNNNLANGQFALFDPQLVKRMGGFIQGQYYFNNQWFMNVAYALTHTYGVDQSRNQFGFQNYAYNGLNNQLNSSQEIDAALWYRPIQAIKFGLQYSYVQTNYWTRVVAPANTWNASNVGNEHRVEFAGYFFF